MLGHSVLLLTVLTAPSGLLRTVRGPSYIIHDLFSLRHLPSASIHCLTSPLSHHPHSTFYSVLLIRIHQPQEEKPPHLDSSYIFNTTSPLTCLSDSPASPSPASRTASLQIRTTRTTNRKSTYVRLPNNQRREKTLPQHIHRILMQHPEARWRRRATSRSNILNGTGMSRLTRRRSRMDGFRPEGKATRMCAGVVADYRESNAFDRHKALR